MRGVAADRLVLVFLQSRRVEPTRARRFEVMMGEEQYRRPPALDGRSPAEEDQD